MGPDKDKTPPITSPNSADLDAEQLVAGSSSIDWGSLSKSWASRGNFGGRLSSARDQVRVHFDQAQANQGDLDHVQSFDRLSTYEELEPELQNKNQLDEFLCELFATSTGYSLGEVINLEEPSPCRLTEYELIAVAFKGVSGFEQDHVWANALFSYQAYLPLKGVIDTLSLCSPSYAVREEAVLSLFHKDHPELVAICSTAAKHESDQFLITQMIRRLERLSLGAALTVANAALDNPLLDRASLRSEIEKLNPEIFNSEELLVLTPHRETALVDPRLSTLVFRSANAEDQRSFAQLVNAVLEEYPTLAAPALAALANTQQADRRAWALGAFDTYAQLQPFGGLIKALPVSAREPG